MFILIKLWYVVTVNILSKNPILFYAIIHFVVNVCCIMYLIIFVMVLNRFVVYNVVVLLVMCVMVLRLV